MLGICISDVDSGNDEMRLDCGGTSFQYYIINKKKKKKVK